MTYAPMLTRAHQATEATRPRPRPGPMKRRSSTGEDASLSVSLRSSRVVPTARPPVDEALEREADRVADLVMRPAGSLIPRIPARPQAPVIQRSTTHPGSRALTPPIVRDVGTPLPPRTRSFMEARFGQDLSSVRVHTGSAAAEACRSLRANAYTVGEDIYFGPGRYRLATPAGDRLMAHELTHVLQQRGGGAPRVQREVDRTAMQGNTFHVWLTIGIFGRPSLYEAGDEGLAGPADLHEVAARWQRDISLGWTGPVSCDDGGEHCDLVMHATVHAYPEAKNQYQVPHANVVRVMESDYRSKVLGWWGWWAHTDEGLTPAHEVGHILGLADKYWYVGGQRSFKRFVGDLMGAYSFDKLALDKADYGPARARLMRLHGQSCPACTSGLRTRPITK